MSPVDRAVFVLGERAAAMELVQALGDTSIFCAMPTSRLLADLVSVVDRHSPIFESLTGEPEGLRPAAWYRGIQLVQLRASGKTRTVEFSGLSILRLCDLFPAAQFLVVRQLKRATPPSGRAPQLADGRILEIDSQNPTTPETLERVLAFLREPAEPVLLDLSDDKVSSSW